MYFTVEDVHKDRLNTVIVLLVVCKPESVQELMSGTSSGSQAPKVVSTVQNCYTL